MDDTIAAVATPPGQGAVALIRISGPDAIGVAGKVFRGSGAVADLAARRQHYGEIAAADGEPIDDVLLTVFRGPASYTGEDSVEIGCHGGMLVTGMVLDVIFAAGARPAEPGEFSQRAFLNGKMDLTQAEAVMDLISARTSLALRAARGQLEGKLGGRIRDLREALIGVLAHVEAYIDFPEEDIDPETGTALSAKLREIAAATADLVATAEQGRILREGVAVVLAGAPNAGKSSLLNVLLGFDRAIVSATPGTTRDTIEEVINLRGIPIRLIDTAGLREAGDEVEQQGIERTGRELERADLVIEVVDASRPKPVAEPPPPAEGARLLVLNKSDLPRDASWEGTDGLPVSCLDGSGSEALAGRIVETVTSGEAGWGEDLVTVNARHRIALIKAGERASVAAEAIESARSPEFVAIDVREALSAIGEIVGQTDVEELLGAIFSSFCIGK